MPTRTPRNVITDKSTASHESFNVHWNIVKMKMGKETIMSCAEVS